jgi:ADP-ribose pyrophosphatase YjhB (NUDIX family)
MAIGPYLERLRRLVGHELLLLPSVAVLPWDEAGRLLLVRNIDTGLWQTIGGLIELDERPQDAARREALEEAGVSVELGAIRAVLGGPEYRLDYPNGDRAAYVSTVFDARVRDGVPRPDGDETSEVRWWRPDELGAGDLDSLNRALLRHAGVTGAEA